jgi:hypothetical protein
MNALYDPAVYWTVAMLCKIFFWFVRWAVAPESTNQSDKSIRARGLKAAGKPKSKVGKLIKAELAESRLAA